MTSSFGCSGPMFTLLLFAFVLLGCVIHSSFTHQLDPKGCMMTHMQPSFFRILDFDKSRTRFADKYGLLLYRDEYDNRLSLDSMIEKQIGSFEWTVKKSAQIKPIGIPVLFIPGNAGSAKQVRSLAKEASRYYYETIPWERDGIREPGSKALDFFTVDFNEEFSAFHGHLLLDQARYVNEAIAYILSLYGDKSNHNPASPRPHSVLLVGHSMGGIVARSIFMMNNYAIGSVNTILTVATPHMIPPIALDYEITSIYDRIEAFWKQGYQSPHGALANVSLVSIMGGNLDITVNSDAGNIHHIVPQSHGFSVFTSSIPHAWVGCDHLSILWCNQVVIAMAKSVVDFVDSRTADQVKPLGMRMKVLRNRLLTGLEDHIGDSHKIETIHLFNTSHTFLEPSRIWTFPPTEANVAYDLHSFDPQYFILPIPTYSEVDTLTVMIGHKLGLKSRLNVLLCKDASASSEHAPPQLPSTLSCRTNGLPIVPLPASTEASTLPLIAGEHFTGQEFRFISKQLKDMAGYQYLVVIDRGIEYWEHGFMIAEFKKEADTKNTVQTTTIGLLRNGLQIDRFPKKASMSSSLRLPNLDTSLLAYNLKVDRPGCHGSTSSRFVPMMKQSSWAMHEDKYAVNIANKQSGIDINFHGDLPYFDKVQLDGNQGLELQFWMDPTCPELLSLNLQIDKYGSLGKVVIRYRMVVLVFTFLVILLTLRAQFKSYNANGSFIHFGVMLTQLIRTTFWKFSILLGVLSALQSFKSRTTVHILEAELLGNFAHSGTGSNLGKVMEQMAESATSWLSSVWFEDALLGGQDAFFWFLAPVFFLVAVGIVVFVWVLLNSIVNIISRLTMRPRSSSTSINESHGTQRRVLQVLVILVLVAVAVPYQFVFAATVLALVVSCARALVQAKAAPAASSLTAWNRFHFMMSILVMFFFLLPFFVPALMVWIRNVAIGWYESFGSDHRVDAIGPFVVLVEGLSYGAMVPWTPKKSAAKVTVALLDAMVVYLLLFGVRYSWQIYYLTKLWISWLLILQWMYTATGRALKERILPNTQLHRKQE
ncbi:GPI inositol deacylase [Mortierella polycephala]|uniref:GPI inositol-deacylase n=1 Tax=Mortierella polycephala TaxID=41804 RepID=A0A9P6QC31_9FUNG|nr:GPI inositol deacylase [Mortierella polycephala]